MGKAKAQYTNLYRSPASINRNLTTKNGKKGYLEGDLYSHTPDFYKSNYFYIHKNVHNIGRMNNRDPQSDGKMAETFSNYKYGATANMSKVVTSQYLNLFKSKQIGGAERKLLEDVFDIENNNTSALLDKIHDAMQKGLEQYLNTDNLVKLLEIEKGLNWSENNTSQLQKALKTASGKYTDELKILDAYLESLVKTVQLVDSNLGQALADKLLIDANMTKNYNNIKAYGRSLKRALNEYKTNNDAKLVNNTLMSEAVANLEMIVNSLATLKNSAGDKKLSIDILKGLTTSNFFPNLSEVLGAQIKQTVVNTPLKIMKEAARTGQDPIPLEMTDADGNYIPDGFLFDKSGSQQGKADNVFKNVSLNLSSITDEYSGELVIDLGISNKSYVRNHFGKGPLEKFDDVYSLGGGMNLGNAFQLLLGNGAIYEKYLGYNIFAHSGELPSALTALQDALLTRSIIYFVSARGKQDFSQFMLLNGQLLSIWDIIKYALSTNIGLSSSQVSGSKQGVYMSIPNHKSFMKYAQSRFWERRIVKTNDMIHYATMKVHIVPKEIINSVKGKEITIH